MLGLTVLVGSGTSLDVVGVYCDDDVGAGVCASTVDVAGDMTVDITGNGSVVVVGGHSTGFWAFSVITIQNYISYHKFN